MGSPEDLYKQVRSGKVKLEQLNDSGKAALKSYMASRETKQKETLVNTGKTVVNTFKKIGDKLGGQLKTAYSDAKERGEAIQSASKRLASKGAVGEPTLTLQEKRAADPSRKIPVIGPVLKTIDNLANFTLPAQPFLESAYTPGAGLSVLNTGTQAAGSLIGKAAPALAKTLGLRGGRIAQTALTEAAVGVPTGVGNVLARNPQSSNRELLEGAGYGAGGGAVLGGLGRGVVEGLDAGTGAVLKRLLDNGVDQSRAVEIAMRTTPNLELPANSSVPLKPRGNVNGAVTEDVIYGMGKVEPRGLPAPNIAPPTTGRIERVSNPYQAKFERLMDFAKDTQFTPGREREELEDLWSRMASRDDPGLDELIDLAYKTKPNKLTPDLVERARTAQGKRDVYGVPLPAKRFSERYDGGVKAQAEAPIDGPYQRIPKGIDKALKNARTDIVTGQPLRPRIDVTPEGPGSNSGNKLGSDPFVNSSSGKQPKPTRIDDETPIVSDGVRSFDPQEFKDISGFSAQTRDLYRNMEKVLGKENASPYLESFNSAKKENIEMQEYWVNRMKSEVVDKLGIQKGSKLSALVQKFGEKKISLEELKTRHPKDWEKVVEADNWFRTSYDDLIDIVNESRVKIYPNNPDKIVPKRNDYYRHFRELNGLEGLKNLFDTPASIDPSLAGISDFTRPQSKFAGFMQKRGLGPYKNDAVGGFLNYLPSASYATKIDPQIKNFRSLASSLADTTGETKNLNNFIEYLNDFSNDLSGKTNAADRFVQKIVPGGRRTMAAISWLSNRVKSNVILGNIGSTLAQTANIPNGIAFAKQYAIPGAGKTLKAIFKESEEMKQSGFLKERFSGKMYRQFDKDWISFRNPLHSKKVAEWLMETSDRAGTTFVWNSAYAKGVAEGVANPVAYADDATRKLVAGRGIGEVPLLQKARITQLVLPFQLEVANLWRVMGDFVSKKDFAALATLLAANYVFNRGIEQVKGSGVVFDPIQAMIEASAEDLTPQERGGRLAGELFSNLPGGQLAASVFPEYGGDVFGLKVPTRKKLFGDNDPTRFGSGIPLQKAFTEPEYTLLSGFGGNQIKKTLQGLDAIQKGGSFTKNDELKFSITQSPAKIAQQLIFGPNATSEAQKYFKSGRRPLGVKDTEKYNDLPEKDRAEMYKNVMNKREREKLEREISEIKKDDSLSYTEKESKIEKIVLKLKPYGPGGEKYVPKGD